MKIKDLFREVKYPIQLFNEQGQEIYYEGSKGIWWKKEYNEQGKKIYSETLGGLFWSKSEYNEQGHRVYFENAYGNVIDNRPKPTKELTIQEVSDLLGYEVKIVK